MNHHQNINIHTPVEDPIHFIGIGGSGMSGLAELAAHRGWKVQGSDVKPSTTLERLRQQGIAISLEHRAEAIDGAKTIVYSSAIASDNIERQEARRRALPEWHRSDFLAHLMLGKKAITIAGTHGKSTTSAMVTHVLDALGQDPTAVVGGTMLEYRSSVRTGKGPYFVAEADESDGSFLKYLPEIGIITNIDHDHMEFFKDSATLEAMFRDYLSRIDPHGCAVVGWDNPLARQVGSEHKGRRLTYGFLIGCDVRAFGYELQRDGLTCFTAIVERDRVECRLRALGKHNVQNALCALAVARALDLDIRQAAASLETFRGVERRMTLVAENQDILIFDDYAHNPGKIAACVQTLKEAWPERALHVVYQAHRYSRLATMYDDMLAATKSADFVYVVPVYAAGELATDEFAQYTPDRLAQDMRTRFAQQAFACSDLRAATSAMMRELKKPAIILTVGAGDVWQVAHQLKETLG